MCSEDYESDPLFVREGDVFIPNGSGEVNVDRYKSSTAWFEYTDPRNRWDRISVILLVGTDTLEVIHRYLQLLVEL